jgi:hypothetical protein
MAANNGASSSSLPDDDWLAIQLSTATHGLLAILIDFLQALVI